MMPRRLQRLGLNALRFLDLRHGCNEASGRGDAVSISMPR